MNYLTRLTQGISLVIAIGMITACGGDVPASASLKTIGDSISYAIGVEQAAGMNNPQLKDAFELNAEMLCRGFLDAVAEKELALDDAAHQQVIATLQQAMMAQQGQQQQQMAQQGEANMAQGMAFLEQNKNVSGVVALPSGLQYKVIEEGSGDSPTANDVVSVHYEGRLINGEVFDSSYERGEPAEFPVGGVIRGWTEALMLMKPGAKWQLFIPSDLAYGPRGSGPQIGPNSTLIFDVELLEVKK